MSLGERVHRPAGRLKPLVAPLIPMGRTLPWTTPVHRSTGGRVSKNPNSVGRLGSVSKSYHRGCPRCRLGSGRSGPPLDHICRRAGPGWPGETPSARRREASALVRRCPTQHQRAPRPANSMRIRLRPAPGRSSAGTLQQALGTGARPTDLETHCLDGRRDQTIHSSCPRAQSDGTPIATPAASTRFRQGMRAREIQAFIQGSPRETGSAVTRDHERNATPSSSRRRTR